MTEMPLVGAEFAGYRLVAVLGRGGMSVVFRAENPRLGNTIALKVLDPGLAADDVFRTRFLEESRIAAAMNHPHVIPIHDMGSADGLLYIAMRCVAGTDLRQMISKRGRLPAETAVFLLSQAARALDAAHRRGLVHRDVKPGNLLVERGNEGADPDHVYLADFGLTKHVSGGPTGLTCRGEFLGTIDYVAPEQIRGISVLGLADQYSLGCVLYECLTGRVPFEKDLDAAIIWAHVEEAPAQPTLLRPELPAAVDDVFARVLAKNPGDRYPSCREFMEAARVALGPLTEPPSGTGTRPVPAGPPGAGQPRAAPFPAPPAGLPGPELAGHPAEVAHETGGGYGPGTSGSANAGGQAHGGEGPTASWPVSYPVPPVPGGSGPAGDGFGGPGGPPDQPGGPGVRSRRGWLVAALALLLVAGAAAGITLGLTGGSGQPSAAASAAVTQPQLGAAMGTSGSMTASPVGGSGTAMAAAGGCTSEQPGDGRNGPATLAAVLTDADKCSVPKGIIPTAKCQPQRAPAGEQVVVCSTPIPQISQVTFRTYPTLAALYAAYTSSVTSLGGSFQQNTSASCGNTGATFAEAGWNHQELHPRQYTTAQMAAGKVPQLDAMGRLACFASGKSEDLLWTTGVGQMLAVATGTGSPGAVYNWWAEIHHVIIFPGTEMCGMSGRMDSVPLGNLVQEPVCPAGAGMTTAGGAMTSSSPKS
jgi:serine/threonine-protein kinase